MDIEFDLWGDPIPPPTEKRGRPRHEVTKEKRLRVSVLRAMNQSQVEIAAALGISERTLRSAYSPELKGGMAQKRAEALVLLWKQAEKGNTSALKEFLRQTEKSDLSGPRAAVADRPAKAARLGKKQQAAIDALSPDTSTTMGSLMADRANKAALH